MNIFVRVGVAAGVVIKVKGKYLLVQEKKLSAFGLWNLPAGRVEEGDSIEKTAIKEAKEETGYKVKLLQKLPIHQNHAQDTSKHAFEAKIISGNLKIPKDELLDAKWFTYKEIVKMKTKLRNSWVIDSISIVEKKTE